MKQTKTKANRILKALKSSYLKLDNCGGYWTSHDPSEQEKEEHCILVMDFCSSEGYKEYITQQDLDNATFEDNTIYGLSDFDRLELYNIEPVKI